MISIPDIIKYCFMLNASDIPRHLFLHCLHLFYCLNRVNRGIIKKQYTSKE